MPTLPLKFPNPIAAWECSAADSESENRGFEGPIDGEQPSQRSSAVDLIESNLERKVMFEPIQFQSEGATPRFQGPGIRTRSVSPKAVVSAAKDAGISAAMLGPNVFSTGLP